MLKLINVEEEDIKRYINAIGKAVKIFKQMFPDPETLNKDLEDCIAWQDGLLVIDEYDGASDKPTKIKLADLIEPDEDGEVLDYNPRLYKNVRAAWKNGQITPIKG